MNILQVILDDGGWEEQRGIGASLPVIIFVMTKMASRSGMGPAMKVVSVRVALCVSVESGGGSVCVLACKAFSQEMLSLKYQVLRLAACLPMHVARWQLSDPVLEIGRASLHY